MWSKRLTLAKIGLYHYALPSHGGLDIYGIDYEETFAPVAKMNMIEKLTLKEKLATQFEMKELGKLKYFLEIEVAYSKQDIFISQIKYVLDLLKEIGKLGYKTLGVPIEQNHRIGCEESPTIEKS
ncbi:hypothetical protein CR513_14110, partial [Mucuna pruriens]